MGFYCGAGDFGLMVLSIFLPVLHYWPYNETRDILRATFITIWKYSKYLIEWIHFVSNKIKLIKYYYLGESWTIICSTDIAIYSSYGWVCVNDILSDKLLIYKQDF